MNGIFSTIENKREKNAKIDKNNFFDWRNGKRHLDVIMTSMRCMIYYIFKTLFQMAVNKQKLFL